jgi:hypothetical protein
MVNVIEERDQQSARRNYRHQQRPVATITEDCRAEPGEDDKAVHADLANRLVAGPAAHQDRAHRIRFNEPRRKAAQAGARQEEQRRAQDFDQIQSAQNLKIVAGGRPENRVLASVVQFCSFDRRMIKLVMQQMARAQNAKRRTEHNRQHPAEKHINAAIRMKHIVNALVQQAPIGIIEQRDGEKKPCPAKIVWEKKYGPKEKLPEIERCVKYRHAGVESGGYIIHVCDAFSEPH